MNRAWAACNRNPVSFKSLFNPLIVYQREINTACQAAHRMRHSGQPEPTRIAARSVNQGSDDDQCSRRSLGSAR